MQGGNQRSKVFLFLDFICIENGVMFRKCLDAGKAVTSCSMEFFRKVKATCASEFMSYASCLEKGDSNMEFAECRKTQVGNK